MSRVLPILFHGEMVQGGKPQGGLNGRRGIVHDNRIWRSAGGVAGDGDSL